MTNLYGLPRPLLMRSPLMWPLLLPTGLGHSGIMFARVWSQYNAPHERLHPCPTR